jgi:hypothetical protein
MRKKVLFYGLSAIMMAACSSDDSISLDSSSINASENARYMAISLVSNDQTTRSAATRSGESEDDPEVITTSSEEYADEYDIRSAQDIIFYFFDANGNPFTVSGENNYVTGSDVYVYDSNSSDTDYKKTGTSSESTDNSGNTDPTYDYSISYDNTGTDASTTSSILIVLEKKSGDTPSQVVAVVNNTDGTTYNKIPLDELRAKIVEKKTLDDKVTTEGTVQSVTSCEYGTTLAEGATHYEQINDETTKKYFTMSNSAYQDASGGCVYATAILPENIKTSATDAAESPVNIYVERLVAKVTSEASTDDLVIKDTENSSNVLSINVNDNKASNKVATYTNMKIKLWGWKLYNTTTSTKLIKGLDGKSTGSTSSTVYYWPEGISDWNSTSAHRSYWSAMTHSKLYGTADDYVEINNRSLSFDQILAEKGKEADYTFENTLPDEQITKNDTVIDNHTGVVYAAQILDAEGAPLSLARWLSQYYTIDNLKESVTKVLANKLYTRTENQEQVTEGTKSYYTDANSNMYYEEDGTYYKATDINAETFEVYTGSTDNLTPLMKNSGTYTYTAITADDVEFINDQTEYGGYSYNVAPKLTKEAAKKTWYNKETGDAYAKDSKYNTSVTSTSGTTVSDILNSVPKAQIWANGYCYYYTQIKHPITVDGQTTVPAVVRNHWYKLTVNGIKGLGTPVFNTADGFDPIKPVDSNWYLDAQIHVLGWKAVSQDVTLE